MSNKDPIFEVGPPINASGHEVKSDRAKASPTPITPSKKEAATLKDLQKCGVYVYFMTSTYAMMVLIQTMNLIFMTFAVESSALSELNKQFLFQFDINPDHVKLGTAFQNTGLLFGALVFGNLADRIGRKWVMLGTGIAMAILGLVSSFAFNFWTFTVARFIVNFFNGGQHCTCNPYLMENLPDTNRMWVATAVTYSPMYIVLAGIAYLCKDWRTLARCGAGLAIIPIIMILLIEETPRWLIQKGRDKEAEKAVLNIKKWDGKLTDEYKESVHSVIESESQREREKRAKAAVKYNSLHIFQSWTLTKYAIVFSISLFSASFVSYGIAFNMEALAGTVYVNVMILGSSRYAINIIAVLVERISPKIGRRMLHIGSISFIVISIAAVMILQIVAHDNMKAFSHAKKEGRPGATWVGIVVQFNRIASLLGAAMCTEIFVLNAVQPPELFPTPIRAGANALIQMFNRLGTILSPLLFKPADWWPPAPYFLMAATALTDMILYSIWIPETRGKPLPDKMPPEILAKHKQTIETQPSTSQASQSDLQSNVTQPSVVSQSKDRQNPSVVSSTRPTQDDTKIDVDEGSETGSSTKH